jgi:hypothetical protein
VAAECDLKRLHDQEDHGHDQVAAHGQLSAQGLVTGCKKAKEAR